MAGQWIDIDTKDGSFGGYLAVPESGSGPGIVLLQEIFGVNESIRAAADLYAEEGYVVLAPDLFWRFGPRIELGYGEEDIQTALGYFQKLDMDLVIADCTEALATLRARPECAGGVGALGFCLGGTLAYLMAARTDVDCAVAYYPVGVQGRLEEVIKIKVPIAVHFAGLDHLLQPEAREGVQRAFAENPLIKSYVYPNSDHAFAAPARPQYDKANTRVAHTRSLEIFRKVLGPNYDLEALWEEHLRHEFATRSADDTLKTMVAEPYVNQVAIAMGGVGAKDLHAFYKDYFIPQQPSDTVLIPVSRTVGVDQLVDEFVFCFTHDIKMDWLLPGVEPTGKYVELPHAVIVRFRGDKLSHEHLYWDQATLLVQVGLLERGNLPITGVEQAQKIRDEGSVPSNELLKLKDRVA